MRLRRGACALLALLLSGPAAGAEPLLKLAKKLQNGLRGQAGLKIAVLGFPYPDGAAQGFRCALSETAD